MKTLVNLLATVVRKAPWIVIVVVVLVTGFLGYQNQNFQPADDQNEAFAPEAAELEAADRITELFGSDSNQSPMQVIVASEGGDVITLDGLEAVQALTETTLTGALSDFVVETTPNRPNTVNYLAPVLAAIEAGAPQPTSDDEVKALYQDGLAQAPAEEAGFITQLLPASADVDSATSPSGLVITFNSGPASNDELTEYVELTSAAAAEIRATPLPEGYSADPFSFELLFEGQEEFETEIGRLFATAAFIILFVLALVFLLKPRSSRDPVLRTVGIAGMLLALVILILPGLAVVLPDLLPSSIEDLESGPALGVASLIYLVVFGLWIFGSPRALRRTTANTFITLLAIMLAITWMNGYGGLRFGSASPMAQILPILLIGLGVDYAIHMNSRYQEEVSAGQSVDHGISTAIRTVGIALVLATITTSVGFLTNVTNPIPALSEFGELASFGIVVSFLLMLTFVPAIRELLDRRAERRDTLDPEGLVGGESRALPRLIGKAAVIPHRLAVPALVVSIVLAVVGGFGVTQLDTKFSVLDFVPTTSPVRDTFATVLEDYGGGFGETTQVLIEGDLATPAAYNAMVGATVNMADTENVIQFGGFPAAESPISVVLGLTNPEAPSFEPSVADVATAAGITPDGPAVSDEADVAGLYAAVGEAAAGQAGGVLADDGDGDTAALFTVQTQAGEAGATQLREDLADDFAAASDAGLTVTATSDEIINDVIITTLRDSQVSSLLLTLAAALLLLVANFWFESRRPMLGVITTVPVILVVLLSFTLMVAFGIAFGPVTATISALAIGIGIPYMIHITHRYLEDRAVNADADAAVRETLVHTGGALAGSAITTMAGFGILVISTTIPFRQFGFVTAYTILLALLAAVLVLPSYLVLWDRWHRRRGEDPVDRSAVEAALQEALHADA